MTCKSCGYPSENVNGQRVPQGHHYGCAERVREPAPEPPGDDSCEHGDCSNLKRPQGKGPKPKYCDEHSTPKSRKE